MSPRTNVDWAHCWRCGIILRWSIFPGDKRLTRIIRCNIFETDDCSKRRRESIQKFLEEDQTTKEVGHK